MSDGREAQNQKKVAVNECESGLFVGGGCLCSKVFFFFCATHLSTHCYIPTLTVNRQTLSARLSRLPPSSLSFLFLTRSFTSFLFSFSPICLHSASLHPFLLILLHLISPNSLLNIQPTQTGAHTHSFSLGHKKSS